MLVTSRRPCAALRAVLGTVLAIHILAPAHAQQPEADASQPIDTALKVSGDGNIELHVVDMPLANVLQMLNVYARRNIITTPSVQGTVSVDLYDATFEQALRAIVEEWLQIFR